MLPYLQHSFWFLPNVAACDAMAKLLREKHNTFWREYEVVVAAGTSAGIGLEALPPVRKAIRNRYIPDGAGPQRLSAGMVDAAVIAELRRLIAAPEIAARVVANYAKDGVRVDDAAIVAALRRFNELWDALFPAEQARIVRLLVNRVTVGRAGIAVDLRNKGLAHLVRELSANTRQEAAA